MNACVDIDAMNNRLFVGNLAFDLTQEDLQDAFAEYRTVAEINLMKDRATGKSRGFAFVTMQDELEASEAFDHLRLATKSAAAPTTNKAWIEGSEIPMPKASNPEIDRGGAMGVVLVSWDQTRDFPAAAPAATADS